MVYKCIKNVQSFLLPPVCLLCGEPGLRGYDLCSGCFDALPVIHSPCPRCAVPLPGNATGPCGRCLTTPPPFDEALSLFHYAHPVDWMLQQLKFHGRLAVAALLGKRFAGFLQDRLEEMPECIIPVPLHARRQRERGFNQSLEIARPIARQLGIPIDRARCRRGRATEPQSSLPAALRRGNIRDAFQVRDVAGLAHVAVVDDVMTSGHTVAELARALRRAGVERVDVWVLARAGGQPRLRAGRGS